MMNFATLLSQTFTKLAPRGLASVYLFGSHAQARAHAESDIDVGILLQREIYLSARERFEARLALVAMLTGVLGTNEVDLVILNDVPPELGRHIVTQGRQVYCADQQLDHDFVRDIQLRAADLDPFLRRTRRIKLQALERS
jgi:predicted nucleotidyltransferase